MAKSTKRTKATKEKGPWTCVSLASVHRDCGLRHATYEAARRSEACEQRMGVVTRIIVRAEG